MNLFSNKPSLILSYFLDNPKIELSQKDIILNIGISKVTAIKSLNFLVNDNLLSMKKIGPTNLYSLNINDPYIKQLKILENIQKLRKLSTLPIKAEIYLYGSSARGEDDNFSDIDLLVIGSIKREEIFSFIEKISKKINKTINYNIFSNLQWSKMQEKDKEFFVRVEKDKIRLL